MSLAHGVGGSAWARPAPAIANTVMISRFMLFQSPAVDLTLLELQLLDPLALARQRDLERGVGLVLGPGRGDRAGLLGAGLGERAVELGVALLELAARQPGLALEHLGLALGGDRLGLGGPAIALGAILGGLRRGDLVELLVDLGLGGLGLAAGALGV